MIFKTSINGLAINLKNINYYIKQQEMAFKEQTFIKNVIIKELLFVLLNLKTIIKYLVDIHQFIGIQQQLIKHQMITLYFQLLMLKNL
jgi:hypothetical protein